MQHLTPRQVLHTAYVTSTLFALQVALLAFIGSSFLERYMSIEKVGLVFTLSSIATIAALLSMPKLLKRFGNFSVISISLVGAIISLIALSTLNQAVLITFFFVLHATLVSCIALNFDIYVEEFSPHDSVGSIRGLYLTLSNAAWVIAQLVIAIILTGNDYWKIYFLATLCTIGAYVWSHRLEHVPDIHYKGISWKETLKTAWSRWNVRHIMLCNLVLQFFFGWMTIYTPVYLHSHLGMSWGELGVVFTIMLLPYVFFEIPLGRLADKRVGEKEILIGGFVLMAISTISLSFITSGAVAIWAVLLFITRVGSSAVEIMNETYFFKKIKAEDDTLLELYRITRPLGYLIAPLIAGFFLFFIGERWLFIPLALITLLGVYFGSKIVDTK